jgi:outer membrane protein assembly factor BamB
MQFLEKTLEDKIFAQVNQNGWGQQMGSMARVVPAAITDGKRVYVNWYGILWALDIETGKLIWWNEHFKKIAEKFNEMIQWQLDSSRFTLTMAGDSLLAVYVNLDKLNNQEPFRLACYDPATGKRKWSSDTGSLQGWAFIGSPLVVDSTIYITAHPKDNQEIHVLAMTMEGKLLWESKLGQPQVTNNWRGMPVYPLPVLKYVGGTLYIMTNNGAVIAFDTVSKSIEWAFSYDLPAGQEGQQQRFWGGYQQYDAPQPGGSAWLRDGILYYKDHGAKTMFALDLSGPKLQWKRPLDDDTMIAGYDDKNFYLFSVGQDNSYLMSVNWETGGMVKASKLPDANEGVRALAAGTNYLMFLSRGIYEVQATNTDVTRDTRIFRGYDKDSLGGILLRSGGRLISVSNLSVTSYPLGDETKNDKRAATH